MTQKVNICFLLPDVGCQSGMFGDLLAGCSKDVAWVAVILSVRMRFIGLGAQRLVDILLVGPLAPSVQKLRWMGGESP